MATKAKDTGKFVVLHGVVSHGGKEWPRGRVISRDDLKTSFMHPGNKEEILDAHDRLTGLGAVRPATEEEADFESVDTSGVPIALSPLAQADLAAKQATIDRLTSLAADLQDKINAAKIMQAQAPAGLKTPPPAEEDNAQYTQMSVEKDAKIEALLRRCNSLESMAMEHQKAQQEASGQAQGPKVKGTETQEEAFQAWAKAQPEVAKQGAAQQEAQQRAAAEQQKQEAAAKEQQARNKGGRQSDR